MIVTEIYTFIVAILKADGVIDWPWSAILLPELIWIIVYIVSILFISVALHEAKDMDENDKEMWKDLY